MLCQRDASGTPLEPRSAAGAQQQQQELQDTTSEHTLTLEAVTRAASLARHARTRDTNTELDVPVVRAFFPTSDPDM